MPKRKKKSKKKEKKMMMKEKDMGISMMRNMKSMKERWANRGR